MDNKLAAKEVEIREIRFQITSGRATIQRLEERAASLVGGEAEVLDSPTCGAATVADIKDCRFQYLALRRIAEINDGVLELSTAVDVVIAGMRPRGKKNSIMSTQSKRIREDDSWRRIRSGVYRLVSFDSKDAAEVDARTKDRERQGKSHQPQMGRKAA